MKIRNDVDGILVVSNYKDTFCIVLEHHQILEGWFHIFLTLNNGEGEEILSTYHNNFADALHDFEMRVRGI